MLDHGVFWVSRNQAQNAADAAAAAGAIARAYDEFADPPPGGGLTVTSATQVAQLNQVWREVPTSVVTFDCPPEVPGGAPVCQGGCASRRGVWQPAAGAVRIGPRADLTGHSGDCHRAGRRRQCDRLPAPLGDPGSMGRNFPSGAPDGIFERYAETGPAPGSLLTPLPDEYDPPTATTTGSGYQFPTDDVDPRDLGVELTLDFGNPEAAHDPISPGWFLPLILPGPKTFDENIALCNAQRVTLGQQIATGSPGMESPSTDGFTNLIAQDPGASWNAATRRVTGSCAPACAAVSPRVVAIAAFNVDEYQFMRANDDWSGCPGGGRCVRIANIVGFFLDHVEGPGRAVGYLTSYPGLLSSGDPEVSNASSFLKAVTLIR